MIIFYPTPPPPPHDRVKTANVTDYFSFKQEIAGQTGNNGTEDVEVMVPLKYLSIFWRNLNMPLINCEINLVLTCSANCVIVSPATVNQGATFTITELYASVVRLSTKKLKNY